jgi:hypothetical protein
MTSKRQPYWEKYDATCNLVLLEAEVKRGNMLPLWLDGVLLGTMLGKKREIEN